MKKILTVRELITALLEFNMDAYVKVNATGMPTPFDICWDGGDIDPKADLDSRKICTEVYFDTTEEEK